jgi:hypothetical protein
MNLKNLFQFNVLDYVPHSIHEDGPGKRERMKELLELLPISAAVCIGHIDNTDGSLTVNWRYRPTESQRRLVELIWVGVFHESIDGVEHTGEPPLDSVTLAQELIREERLSLKS